MKTLTANEKEAYSIVIDSLLARMRANGENITITARLIGCSPCFLSRVANGERRPTIELLNLWAALYGLKVELTMSPLAFAVYVGQ